MEQERYRKVFQGTIVSDRTAKTRTVQVSRTFRHSLYHKVLRRNKKYHVHDEHDQSHTGDMVEIREMRPLSKQKRWRIVKIVAKAKKE